MVEPDWKEFFMEALLLEFYIRLIALYYSFEQEVACENEEEGIIAAHESLFIHIMR